jgi:hypothetical protein
LIQLLEDRRSVSNRQMYHNVEDDVRIFYKLHGNEDAPQKVLFVMGNYIFHHSK